MDVALGLAQGMGPERVCPNQHEDAGPQEAPEGVPDPVGDWSGEEPEEEEEDSGGYLYQPLNQDPEQGPWEQSLPAAEEATGSTEPAPGIQERLQVARSPQGRGCRCIQGRGTYLVGWDFSCHRRQQ